MSALLFALALLAADAPADPPAAGPAAAPQDDYLLVAGCYGSLRAYLDLHDQVMPEVTRIESTYRPPGRKLADDLKVYADMQKDGERQLKIYAAAMTAAEKASLRPINAAGAQAVTRGRRIWMPGPGVTPARLAQEWMSWTLPARCEITAKALEARASLLGASFRVNTDVDAAPAPAPMGVPDLLAAPPEAAPEPKPPVVTN